MLLQIEFHWIASDTIKGSLANFCQNPLVKKVEFPSIPHVGMELWPVLPKIEGIWFEETLIVENVIWDEEGGFIAETNCVNVECGADEFRSLMLDLGWVSH